MGTADGFIVGTTKVVDHGPNSERWNVVVMGDGYTSGEMPVYRQEVQNFINLLRSTPPFNELWCGINVHRIDVVSSDSGADDPAMCGDGSAGSGLAPRTFFDASYCSGGSVRRALAVNNGTVIGAAARLVPEFHVMLVSVNSTIWGGTGGQVGTFSRSSGSANIAIHEIGHSAFGLADEYEYRQGCGIDTDRDTHPASEPSQPNVTVNLNRNTMKWANLIAPATPVPTTSNANCTQCDLQASPVTSGTVGAFEGANTFHCGAFRPEFTCMMRSSGSPFCSVCSRVIRNTLKAFVPPVLPRVAMRSISVAPLSDKRLELWVVDDQGHLNTSWKSGVNSESLWVTGVNFLAEVPIVVQMHQTAAAPLSDGRLELWAVDNQGRLFTTWKVTTDPNAGWAPWADFLVEVPLAAQVQQVAVAPLSDGRLELWAVDSQGRLFTTWKVTTDPNADWAPWVDFLDEIPLCSS